MKKMLLRALAMFMCVPRFAQLTDVNNDSITPTGASRKETDMRRLLLCILTFFLLSFSINCFSQQTDIREYSVIPMYSYLTTPSLNLVGRGFNGDFARNVFPWMSLGFDFSTFTGGSTLLPSYLNAPTQAKLGALPPPLLATLANGVPYTNSTCTYQGGPQINIRKLKRVTFAVRPALGMLHIKIQTTIPPENVVARQVVAGLLDGKLSASDTAVFYGFGGGATLEINPHFGLRLGVDMAHYNFFSSLLTGGRNSVRFSLGPKFSFGKNIVTK